MPKGRPSMRDIFRRGGSLAAVVLLWLGCTAATRQSLKRFFFEVPGETAMQDGPRERDVPRPRLAAGAPAPVFLSVHDPFRRHECQACHEPSRTMAVRAELIEVCGDCHERYVREEEVRHEPVAEGDCTLCHDPHRSTRPHLLRAPLFELCVDCHDEPEELSQPAHAVADVQRCTRCHDPHFGGEYLLRTGASSETLSPP